jgi:hypothetical protein
MNPEQLTLFDPDMYLVPLSADPDHVRNKEQYWSAPTVTIVDRRYSLDDLGGVTEVAEVLACAKQQIAALRKRADFPKPVLTLAATPVWSIADINAFKATWNRRGPRKPAVKPVPTEAVVSED